MSQSEFEVEVNKIMNRLIDLQIQVAGKGDVWDWLLEAEIALVRARHLSGTVGQMDLV